MAVSTGSAGAGPYSALGTIIVQNGIQVSRGASAQILGNTVSGNQYSGGGAASSAGVVIHGAAVTRWSRTSP